MQLFVFCCGFVVGANIRRTAKIAITTEGLGRTEPFLSRFVWCDTRLSEILHFEWKHWSHFQKKVLKTSISSEYTQKIELNSIDLKNTCDTELNFTIYPTWPQPHLNTSWKKVPLTIVLNGLFCLNNVNDIGLKNTFFWPKNWSYLHWKQF